MSANATAASYNKKAITNIKTLDVRLYHDFIDVTMIIKDYLLQNLNAESLFSYKCSAISTVVS